jgi:hypothetical protein
MAPTPQVDRLARLEMELAQLRQEFDDFKRRFE